jgi:Glycosyl hydrolase family 1
MVVAVSGYVNVPGAFAGWFPPGVFSFTGALRAVRNLARANAVAYDAVHRHDERAQVGPVHNMIAFTPSDPNSALDRGGAEHADYIFNRVYLKPGGRWLRRPRRGRCGRPRRASPGPARAGRLHRAQLLLPQPSDGARGAGQHHRSAVRLSAHEHLRASPEPDGPALPDPLYGVRLGDLSRGLPSSARNRGWPRKADLGDGDGLADADDDLRAAYVVDHLRRLRAAMRAGEADVKGYFAWSLMDNFEWAAGNYSRFGFFSYDQRTLARHARPSARVFRRIARSGRLPR